MENEGLKRLMITLTVSMLALFLSSIYCIWAWAGADFGTEGGGNKPCVTTDLPANVWTLVGYDNAGQPAVTKPSADQTGHPDATWDWATHGTLIVANKPRPGGVPANQYDVQTQLWIGNGGGACFSDGEVNGTIICDNPATHYLQESQDHFLAGRGRDLSIPFEFLVYQAAPYFSVPGDANYFGLWLFAKPSIPAICRSINYADLVYIDEAQ
jgi:hypothetical protein